MAGQDLQGMVTIIAHACGCEHLQSKRVCVGGQVCDQHRRRGGQTQAELLPTRAA